MCEEKHPVCSLGALLKSWLKQMELLEIAIAEIRPKEILWSLQQGISVTESTTLRAFKQEMLTLKFHHSALPPDSVAVRLPPLQHTHTHRVN
jgi:hypothetical protein